MDNENTVNNKDEAQQLNLKDNEETIKDKVLRLVEEVCDTRKSEVIDLLAYLESNGYYEAPASAMHHNNFQGGLALHSYSVAKHMVKLVSTDCMYNGAADLESCVIVGLFHDAFKATDGFGNDNYVPNILKSGKQSESKPYITNPNLVFIPGPIKSLLIVTKYLTLLPDETQAILYHDGLYERRNYEVSNKETPLLMLLHHVDVFHSFFRE